MLDSSFVLLIRVAAGFEDVVEADEVGFDVGIGVGDAVAYACLCSKVDYNLGPELGKEFVDELAVGYVAFDKAKARVLLELCQTFFFEANVVVIVHVVDAYYFSTFYLLVDGLYQVATNEACGSCYKYFHELSSLIHILIIFLIFSRCDIIHPLLIIEIPFYCLFNTFFKLKRWFPT